MKTASLCLPNKMAQEFLRHLSVFLLVDRSGPANGRLAILPDAQLVELDDQLIRGFVELGKEQVGSVAEAVVAEIDDIVGQRMEAVVNGDELLVVSRIDNDVRNILQGHGQGAAPMFGKRHVGIIATGERVDELASPMVVQAYGAVDIDTRHERNLRLVESWEQTSIARQEPNYAAERCPASVRKLLVSQECFQGSRVEEDQPYFFDMRQIVQ